MRRERYEPPGQPSASDIEAASAPTTRLAPADRHADPRLRKLDELMWTYLRLLSIEESLGSSWKPSGSEECPPF